MQPRPLLLFLCLLLPASQSPVRSPQLLLEILGPDLDLLLSGHETGVSSPPPLAGHLPRSGPPPLPPGHPWLPLLRELAKSHPRRLRGPFRRGSPSGCFGVKLDRIGTFSGLGC